MNVLTVPANLYHDGEAQSDNVSFLPQSQLINIVNIYFLVYERLSHSTADVYRGNYLCVLQ